MSQAVQYVDRAIDVLTATIASSGDTSDAIFLGGTTAIGFATPAALTATTFTFLGSMNKTGDDFVTIRDQLDAIVTYTVSVDSGYALDATIFAPYDRIKVFTPGGSTEAAERLITIKPFAL